MNVKNERVNQNLPSNDYDLSNKGKQSHDFKISITSGDFFPTGI